MFNNLETGQVNFASSADAANDKVVAPGTFAVTSKCDSVIAPLSKVIVQVVLISSGVSSFEFNTKLSFMLKQPACAAAINSSGLVPMPSANLVDQEY